jgi:hypothetical protein
MKFIARRSDNTTQTLVLDRVGDVRRGSDARFFDNKRAFMLDSKKISPIIYIWYEGGWLSPPVVTAKRFVGG